jgi:serine/threonine-protein kinase
MAGKKPQWLGRNHQYRLVSVIAEDRLGALWRAENAFLSQPVTARVVSEALGSDREFVVRFRTAMDKVSRNVSHPNAAAVFSYNWGDDGPTQFVVMEAVEGETLAERIGRSRGIDQARSLRIALQVADALQAAHAVGVVHGGLSATTVMLSSHDDVKVLDFGLGAAAWDRPAQMAGPRDAYVPPEWVLGAKRRPSWDAYAIAILLHHMLTGTPDLPDRELGTSRNGSREPAGDAAALLPGLAGDAADVWLRALAWDPRDRPSTKELAAALRIVTEP